MIKNYLDYLNESFFKDELTYEQERWLDKSTRAQWIQNLQTGLVDVKGNFNCNNQSLTSFKGVKFNEVKGDFYCNYNSITSLAGSPRIVEGDFDCTDNNLSSLEGGPEIVKGSYFCFSNDLTSLKGFPSELGGEMYLDSRTLEKKFSPFIDGMNSDEKKFFYKIVGTNQNTDEEFLRRIASSIERMRII